MTKRLFWWLLAAAELSFAAQLILYPSLPQQVPLHWGISGQPDGWGAKPALLALWALPIVLLLLLYLMPRLDPRKDNYSKHTKAYSAFSIAVILLFIALGWALVAIALGVQLPLSSIVIVLLGILFVVIGNFMPQVRPNYFFGIKTPWTLANETVWRKTHRLGGVLFVLCGLTTLVSAFLPEVASFVVMVGGIVAATVVMVIYSYLAFKNIPK